MPTGVDTSMKQKIAVSKLNIGNGNFCSNKKKVQTMKLELNNISKTYKNGNVKAVTEFSTAFTPGVYGLLGANGAGKSTIMNMITGNLRPDTGSIFWNGEQISKEPRNYFSILGYMPQQQGLYGEFTAKRFMWYMASLKGISKEEAARQIPELLRTVNLDTMAARKLKTFSGGMKQRILIAQALLGNPRILVLDEPTAGLDPKERIRIRNSIGKLGQDRIVLIATHVVSDVETIAKEILILKKGRLLRRGSVPELLQEMEGRVWMADYAENWEEDACSTLQMGRDGYPKLRLIRDRKPDLPGCEPAAPTLEDLYLSFFADEDAHLL